MLKRAWEYVVSVAKFYKSHISGWMLAILAVGLQIASAKYANDPAKSVLVVRYSAWVSTAAAVWALFVAQYDAWRGERTRAENAEKRLTPRLKIGMPQQHFWGLEENRGSTGTGYYFQVTNLSESDTLESVKAHIISIEPNEIKTLTLPLTMHIKDMDYETAETFLHPKAIVGFDIATGPDHNINSQQPILIPCIVAGDRGITKSVEIPHGRYRVRVMVSAKNCTREDAEFDLWIENNFLRCAARRISGEEVL